MKAARAQPIIRGTNRSYDVAKEKAAATVDKTHLERWKITGVVALAERNLEVLMTPLLLEEEKSFFFGRRKVVV